MFRNEGFKIVKEKKIKLEKIDAEKFYKVHETKPFYNDLCEYLSSGPIVVMILEKNGAVLDNRRLMGATDPKNADLLIKTNIYHKCSFNMGLECKIIIYLILKSLKLKMGR